MHGISPPLFSMSSVLLSADFREIPRRASLSYLPLKLLQRFMKRLCEAYWWRNHGTKYFIASLPCFETWAIVYYTFPESGWLWYLFTTFEQRLVLLTFIFFSWSTVDTITFLKYTGKCHYIVNIWQVVPCDDRPSVYMYAVCDIHFIVKAWLM